MAETLLAVEQDRAAALREATTARDDSSSKY
jgi:hypothetical protein